VVIDDPIDDELMVMIIIDCMNYDIVGVGNDDAIDWR